MTRRQFALTVAGIMVPLVIAILQLKPWEYFNSDADPPMVVAGRVVHAHSEKPIEGATVQVEGPQTAVRTDDFGNFEVKLTPNTSGQRLRLTVYREGFRPVSRSVVPPLQQVLIVLEAQ
jgi:hypothetical protein